MSVERYRELNSRQDRVASKRIQAWIPRPSERDYLRGYITRWFLQRLNDPDSHIIEINQDLVNSYLKTPVYNIVKLEWRISGDLNSIKASNRESISIASLRMPNLYKYLPNLIQFSSIK